jgi:hypothetical protein
MKSTVAVIIFVLTLALLTLAQDDTAKFKYQRKRAIPPGTVLHYLKTNIDGSKPEYVSQYFATPSLMESFKFHPREEPAGHVEAEMDWDTFSAAKITSHQVFADESRKLFGIIKFDAAKREANVSIKTARPKPETVALPQFPIHLYNFDLGTLNFAFPHLIAPMLPFNISIIDPSFRDDAPLIEVKGQVTITYVGEESRNKVLTRKYRIDGDGLRNKGGYIWVNKVKGWIEDMEIALPDNPEWTSFKLKLLRTEKIDLVKWEKFMSEQLKN